MTKHAVLSGSDISQTQFFSQINGGLRIHFKSDFSGMKTFFLKWLLKQQFLEAKFPGFKMTFNRFHFANNFDGYDPCPEIFHMAENQYDELPTFKWFVIFKVLNKNNFNFVIR